MCSIIFIIFLMGSQVLGKVTKHKLLTSVRVKMIFSWFSLSSYMPLRLPASPSLCGLLHIKCGKDYLNHFRDYERLLIAGNHGSWTLELPLTYLAGSLWSGHCMWWPGSYHLIPEVHILMKCFGIWMLQTSVIISRHLSYWWEAKINCSKLVKTRN